MSTKQLTAVRYAQAAFELANEQKETDKCLEDLALLKTVMAEPQISLFFSNPKVPLKDKEAVLRQNLSSFKPQMLNMACLLASKGLLSLAADIYHHYQTLYNEFHGLATAYVTTAVAMTEEEKMEVTAQLGHTFQKKVTVVDTVDPYILGGMTARVGDKLIDGSLASQLNEMRCQMTVGHS